MNTALIHADDVAVYVGSKALVENVSLAAQAGETVALVGPNGAGKSTLLKVLSGEITPHRGRVFIKGRDIRSFNPRQLAFERAVLPQSVVVPFPFTVLEIVRMGAGDRRSVSIDRHVDCALALVDLEGLRDRTITTLSGGEQQRAHFARVMVQLACSEEQHGPGVLLLDEPTASLDLRHQLDLLNAVAACARRGVAVIAVLHDLNLASLFAQRIVMMQRGRVAIDGPADVTITDEMLARVFKVKAGVSRTPSNGAPFILPHAIEKRE